MFDMYRELLSEKEHPNVQFQRCAALPRAIRAVGTLGDMKNIYTQHVLYTATGAVYSFFTFDKTTEAMEIEVYPTSEWLTLMQSPKMSSFAADDFKGSFNRLTSNDENCDNYAMMSVNWRGLEHKVISQVFTPSNTPGLAGDRALFRPEFLAIDPFLLTRLKPAHEAMKKQELGEAPLDELTRGESSHELADNVTALDPSRRKH